MIGKELVMKISQFDCSNLRGISLDIDAALKQISEKYGIDFARVSTSFNTNLYSANIKFGLRQSEAA